MNDGRRIFRIEMAKQTDSPVEWFDSADAAMTAVNRYRTMRLGDFVIQDGTGAALTERQLAMLVMEAKLQRRGQACVVSRKH